MRSASRVAGLWFWSSAVSRGLVKCTQYVLVAPTTPLKQSLKFTASHRYGYRKEAGVQALRRTVKDMFTFIPFIVILVIPMTPLGHVLVFGFIQRYFPDFFPSQFNTERQDMVKRYEDLRKQLSRAQAVADHEEVRAATNSSQGARARVSGAVRYLCSLWPLA